MHKHFNFDLMAFDGESEGMAEGVATSSETEQQNETQPATEDKSEAFEKLIKGEYKAEYDKRVKDTLNKRFKSQRDSEAELGRYTPLAELLSQKYGTSDPEELFNKIDSDDSFYEDEAYEKGMTVEQLRQMKNMSRENEAYRAQLEELERQDAINNLYADWMNQAEMLKETFPNLDMEEECDNPKFTQLLEIGFSVEEAYKACHSDEIISSMMAATAKNVRQETVDNIASRSMRPSENGMRATAGSEFKIDPSKLTREELRKIKERVRRGESISL